MPALRCGHLVQIGIRPEQAQLAAAGRGIATLPSQDRPLGMPTAHSLSLARKA